MQSLVNDLQRDREAASGQGVRSSHLATWTKFHHHALGEDATADGRTPVLPLTPDNIVLVAALFKAGDYRSYSNYLSDMKGYHLDEGHTWTERLVHVGRWTTRSVMRGIGPARQSQPIPLPLVMALHTQLEPLVMHGPTHPRETYLLAACFLLREVEISATRVEHVDINLAEGTITWTLSASKTDPKAFGVTRTLGCMCGHSLLPCPLHLALLVVSSTKKYAADRGLTPAECNALPLFHDGTGCAPSKASMVVTFEILAQQCGLPICSNEGARRFGGHTPRVAGAQALATAGAEVNKIRIFARHSGEAILRYVAEAPLTSLRHDLGRQTATTKGTAADSKIIQSLIQQLKILSDKVEEHDSAVDALITFTREHRVIAYVQNLSTLAIHGQRAGDSKTTICGFPVGPARVKRGAVKFLHSITGESWDNLCEQCLLPEREAAIALEQLSILRLPDSSSKRLLAQ